MERKPVYEDFEVHTEWVHEPADDTVIAKLPGFRKEQLKVQITSTGNLRISGERSIGNNKFSRFLKEIPIPSNCDPNKIGANFTSGVLHVKFHKLIVPVEEETKPSTKVPKPDQKPAADHPRPVDVSPPEKPKNNPGLSPPAKEQQAEEKKKSEKEKGMKDEKNAANEAAEKAMQKEEKGTPSEELGDSVKGSAAKLEPKNPDGTRKFQTGMDYKQVLEGLKNPKKIMNMVLAVLAVVVLGVYVRNAIRFLSDY